jgi:hypothetical protein
MGADPELFLEDSKGNIVPSSEAIPEDGWDYSGEIIKRDSVNKVVRDGIQIELNSAADTCRELSAYNLAASLAALRRRLEGLALEGKKYKVSKAGVIHLPDSVMKKLPKESLEFGCKPSFNIYDPDAIVGVEGDKYNYRSGSGHVHLGKLPHTIWFDKSKHYSPFYNKSVDRRQELVQLLDIVLGNTCVMIDRDPLQKERRKHYGRAGEYRLPDHGLEYRTLSNFWLRDYALASFVFGMARYAVMILHSSHMAYTRSVYDEYEKKEFVSGNEKAYPYATELIESVDVAKIREAIDNNDPDLAAENFKAVAKFIRKYQSWNTVKTAVYTMPLDAVRLIYFKYFIEDVKKRGLDAIFKKGILEAWTTTDSNGTPIPISTTTASVPGWESFLDANYRPTVEKLAAKLKKSVAELE